MLTDKNQIAASMVSPLRCPGIGYKTVHITLNGTSAQVKDKLELLKIALVDIDKKLADRPFAMKSTLSE